MADPPEPLPSARDAAPQPAAAAEPATESATASATASVIGPDAESDVDAVARAVLIASRLLVAVSVRSLATVQDRVTLPQFRLLKVLSAHGGAKLVSLADWLG